MQERELKAKLLKIKNSIAKSVDAKRKVDNERDNLFAEVMSGLDQDYDHMIALVRVAKYELIFDEVLTRRESEEDTNNDTDVI